jgi:hypothetical protein
MSDPVPVLNTDVNTVIIEAKPKRSRTKLRKVKEGIKFNVKCEERTHTMYLTPKGRMVLAHHSDLDLSSELVLNALGGDACGCATALKAWRTCNMDNVNEAIYWLRCPTVDGANTARVIRKLHNNLRKKNSRKVLDWPKTLSEASAFFTYEFNKVDLRFYEAGSRSVYAEDGTKADTPRYYLKPKVGAGGGYYSTVHEIMLTFNPKNNGIYLQSYAIKLLNRRRVITAENVRTMIDAISTEIRTSETKRGLQNMQAKAESIGADTRQRASSVFKNSAEAEIEIGDLYTAEHGNKYLIGKTGRRKEFTLSLNLPANMFPLVPIFAKRLNELVETTHNYLKQVGRDD